VFLTVYRNGETRRVPAIDFTPAFQAQGWSTTRPNPGLAVPQVEIPFADPPASPALELINTAVESAELIVLPTIGAVRAAAILENRPPRGYANLGEIAALTPHGIDWDAVAAWGNG
jgi:hypothetical protein